jgi:hypothetical protein
MSKQWLNRVVNAKILGVIGAFHQTFILLGVNVLLVRGVIK